MVDKMSREVHQFMDEEEQSDDLTMLAIKYTPKRDEYTHEEEITLQNDIKYVDQLNDFVESITDKLGINTSKAHNIKLAVEEAVVNVMEYAYPAGTTGDIDIQAMYNDRKLKFVITDSGVAFNPTKATLADTTLTVEERPVGGLGLLLVRELMDSINYERINHKNTLTLITHYKSKEQE
jgi:sigma-B regulation protein RsbU (phosphoserine phosphatase)